MAKFNFCLFFSSKTRNLLLLRFWRERSCSFQPKQVKFTIFRLFKGWVHVSCVNYLILSNYAILWRSHMSRSIFHHSAKLGTFQFISFHQDDYFKRVRNATICSKRRSGVLRNPCFSNVRSFIANILFIHKPTKRFLCIF